MLFFSDFCLGCTVVSSRYLGFLGEYLFHTYMLQPTKMDIKIIHDTFHSLTFFLFKKVKKIKPTRILLTKFSRINWKTDCNNSRTTLFAVAHLLKCRIMYKNWCECYQTKNTPMGNVQLFNVLVVVRYKFQTIWHFFNAIVSHVPESI